jgi:phage terminase small subunit
MKQFVISIQKEGSILNQWEKIPFDLNPSRNIAQQAEKKVMLLLAEADSNHVQMDDVAWKVYRQDGRKYSFVSRSENWVGE